MTNQATAIPESPVTDTDSESEVPAPKRMCDTLKTYRSSYVRGVHNGDALAKALDGRDLLDMQAIARRVLGEDLAEEKITKYQSLNNGQQRMNLGNMVRNRIKKNPELLAEVYEVVGNPE